jgi:hypothetical protein
MTADRIKEIQSKTAFPDSVSVCQALLQVWNECEQDNKNKKYTEEDVFLIAQKLWNDLTNNDTLTYNTFEEYFNDKLKK